MGSSLINHIQSGPMPITKEIPLHLEAFCSTLWNTIRSTTPSSCSDQSRCRTDPNYQSRRRVITDPAAEKLLLDATKKSVIFQKSELFVHSMSTAHVESFNNFLNLLHNKRIAFGNDTYKLKTAMADGFWNDGKAQFSKTIWSAHVASLAQ